jgi:integrase
MRVYTGQRDPRDNPVQRTRTFRGAKREAETALSKFVAEVQKAQRAPDAGGVTVSRLLDRWLAHSRRLRTPQTIRGYESKIEVRLKPAFGTIRVDKLRAHHVDDQMNAWLDEGLSAATVRQLYSLLAAALHQGHKWGWVDEIVTKKASPPAVRSAVATVPSPAELRRLIARAEQSRDNGELAAAITLAAATGCRRGELCALRWSDIDVTTGTVTVGRSLGYINRQGVVEGGTKTHQVRRLALDDFGRAVVKSRVEAQRKAASDLGVELDPDPYLLSRGSRGDTPCLPDGLTHGFARVAKAEGLPYHFHHLRHWAATTALSEGHDVRTVAGRLGHADASTTLKVYAHVVEARDQELAGTLGRALRGG